MKKALLVTALVGTLGISTIVGYAASTLENQTVKGVQQVTENVAHDVAHKVQEVPQNLVSTVSKEVAVSLTEAREIALQKVKGELIGTDVSDGREYEFDIQHGDNVSEVTVDKMTGEITKVEQEFERPVKADISEQQAQRIALDRVSNGEIVKFQLEEDDGLSVYDIEIVKDAYEYEVKIDASTGDVIEYEQDDLD